MSNLISRIRSDLRDVMDQYELTRAQVANWCSVSVQTITNWRLYGTPEFRVFQVAHHIRLRCDVDDEPLGNADGRLIEALEWYADHMRYSPASNDRRNHSPTEITVYRAEALNDRGAIARQALREVGHG